MEDGKLKRCSKCGEHKPYLEFSKNKNTIDGYYSQCKHCHNSSRRKRYATPEGILANLNKHLKRVYGITAQDYDDILAKQNFCCKICGGKPDNAKVRLSVDHNHQNGNVRGLLCIPCNNILGMANDDIFILKSAISYLEEAQK